MGTTANTRRCARCNALLAGDNKAGICWPCQRAARGVLISPPDVPREFWDDEELRDALLRERHIGHALRRYRNHPYHGYGKIPQTVAANWFNISQGQLGRIETGRRVDDLGRLIQWAKILRIPQDLLWFTLPGEASQVKNPAEQTGEHAVTSEEGSGGIIALKALIRKRHLSYNAFCREWDRAAGDVDKALAGHYPGRTQYYRWLRGELTSKRPYPDACRILEAMFPGWPVEKLFLPYVEAQLWPETSAPPEVMTLSSPAEIAAQPEFSRRAPTAGVVYDNELEVDDVERRELLKIFSSLAVAAPFTSGIDPLRRNLDGALNSPTTESDVEEWERIARQYATDSGLIWPSLLLPDLLTDLDEAQFRLKNSPDALQGPMARVCGQLSALAAINLFNAGDEGNARRYWRTALRTMTYSGDRSAQAGIYGQRAVFALYERRSSAADVLALSGDAIKIADGTSCTGAANACAARALALAATGESSESVHAVNELSDVSARIPGVTTAALESWGWSEQSLRFIESRVYAYAGRPADAAKANEAGLSIVPDGQYLAASQFRLNMAICMIAAGDPSEGARQVIRTLQALPGGYRQSIPIRDTARRALNLVPAGAVNTSAVSEARELLSSANS